MNPRPKILVATDFSEGSRQALEEAIVWARRLDGEVTVVHAFEPPIVNTAAGFGPMADSLRAIESAVNHDLAQLQGEYETRGIALQVRSVLGPVESIAELAQAEGYQLLVVGTHGRTGLRRLVLGSSAEQILRASRVPVLAVRERTAQST